MRLSKEIGISNWSDDSVVAPPAEKGHFLSMKWQNGVLTNDTQIIDEIVNVPKVGTSPCCFVFVCASHSLYAPFSQTIRICLFATIPMISGGPAYVFDSFLAGS